MDINITYDLLFDILRIEKSREELQKLDDNFYKNTVDYINNKESSIGNPNVSTPDKELTRIQLHNVKKILSELYDRREKKIINLAIYKTKTISGVINTDVLLEEEKRIFDNLYSQLSKYRSEILNNVLSGKVPQLIDAHTIVVSAVKNEEPKYEDDLKIKSVRFIRAVPRFLGPELETYGPFEENDIASLPSKIANILVKKDRAEEIHAN